MRSRDRSSAAGWRFISAVAVIELRRSGRRSARAQYTRPRSLDDTVRRDVDVVGRSRSSLSPRARLEVGIPAVQADDGVRAVARHPDDPRLGHAREDAVDAAAKAWRAVREQAPAASRFNSYSMLDRPATAPPRGRHEGVELEVAGHRDPGPKLAVRYWIDQLLLGSGPDTRSCVICTATPGDMLATRPSTCEHPVAPPAVHPFNVPGTAARGHAGRAVAAEGSYRSMMSARAGCGRLEGVTTSEGSPPRRRAPPRRRRSCAGTDALAAAARRPAPVPRADGAVSAEIRRWPSRRNHGTGDRHGRRLEQPLRSGRPRRRCSDGRLLDAVAAVPGVDGVGDAADGCRAAFTRRARTFAVIGGHAARNQARRRWPETWASLTPPGDGDEHVGCRRRDCRAGEPAPGTPPVRGSIRIVSPSVAGIIVGSTASPVPVRGSDSATRSCE